MATATAYARRHDTSTYIGLVSVTALLGLAIALGYAVAVGEFAAFFVALSVVGGIAVLFDYRLGAVLLVLMLPLGATYYMPHSLFGVPALNPLNVLILATAAAFFLRGGTLRGLAPRALVWMYVVPILLAGLLGMRHVDDIAPFFFEGDAINFSDALGYFREMAVRPLLIVLVALLLGVAVTKAEKPERFITAIIVAVWLIALIEMAFIAFSGIRLGLLASPSSRAFFDEIGLHANALGRLFAVAYALLLFVWWETRNAALKGWLFATLAVATVAMLLTFSRGALLGFFVVNALFLVWKFNARTIGLALIAAALAAVLAPEYLWSRITFGFDADANAVSADRIEGIWLPLLPELLKSPLWGNGLGSIMWSFPMQIGAMLPVGHPHNAYMEALLDMGVIGLALMLAYYWHVWKGFRAMGSNPYLSPEMRSFFQGATAALACFLVTGGAGSSFRPAAEFAFLWLAIGMMYGVRARKPAS